MKKYISMILILSLIFISKITVFATSAEPTITFNGTSQEFTFNNVMTSTGDSGQNTPDLFTNLKAVVPGDELTQDITLNIIDIKNDEQVKIYLKSEMENDDYVLLLDSINLTVKSDDEDITGNLSDSVLLGTFTQDEALDIDLELDIPTTVGNEISDLTGEIDWVFTAEVIEDTSTSPDTNLPTQPDIPQTGDTSYIVLWVFLIVILSISIVFIKKK